MNMATENKAITIFGRLRQVGLGLIMAAVTTVTLAENSLDEITSTALPGDRVQLRITLSQPVNSEPMNFTIDDPARIALDFPDTAMNLPSKNQAIGVGIAHSVTAVEAGGRTRVVLNLDRMVPYEMQLEGSDVVVTLENDGSGGPVELAEMSQDVASSGASLEAIDFRRGETGEGRVMVKLSDPSIGVNIQEEAGKILVDFINTRLPENLDRRLDVVDFATPVQEIDTRPRGNGVRMSIQPTGFYEHLAYQSDDLLVVEFKPLTEEEEEQIKKEKIGYTGERLSLNFQNIEVRAVLQLLADFTGKNLVTSDTVTGNVTLRLKNVPWDQALDIILKSKGLDKRENGNVLMVAPAEEIATRERLELESRQQIAELAPLNTEFVQINYAKAGDLADLIKAESNNLLSERGDVTIDDRTNTLIIQDTALQLAQIRRMIDKLDIPVRQVLIESRIVIANEDFSKDLGVRFGYSRHTNQQSQADGDLFGALGGKLDGDTNYGGTTSFHTDNLENYLVDLPVAGAAGSLGLAIGKIGTWLLQLELSALQAEGRGEVVSSPRVITANQKEATIESGTEIPYQEASSSGATSVSFKKAVLSLKVTPQITPDDRINMNIDVSKDAVGSLFAGIPSIDTNNVVTEVLVDNGETVVLGGIYEQTSRNDVTRVPFFGSLPYVGNLFKNTSLSKDKSELLIFVTPKLLKEELALN